MSIRCAIGWHKWKPVVRGALARRLGSMADYDFLLAYPWFSIPLAGIMAQHYIDALWRGFHKRGEICARCRKRR